MATKKKTSPIFYVGTPTATPQTQSAVIPNYEDSGVKFQGYYKQDVGGGKFELRKQEKRFYSCNVPSPSADFDYYFSRVDIKKRFYCSFMNIDYKNIASGQNITIYDGVTSNPKTAIRTEIAEGHIQLDFSSSPREFRGAFIVVSIGANLIAGERLRVTLHGWDEE